VPVNIYALRNGRLGMAIVAAAGPLSNLLLASVLALPIRLGLAEWHSPFAVISTTAFWSTSDYVGLFLSAGILLNVILAVFNFIPLAPLDGFKVALGLLPIEVARPIAQLERYGMVILMGIFFLGPMVGINFFGWVVRPAVETIASALLGV
jgi:Zn-dependent protease